MCPRPSPSISVITCCGASTTTSLSAETGYDCDFSITGQSASQFLQWIIDNQLVRGQHNRAGEKDAVSSNAPATHSHSLLAACGCNLADVSLCHAWQNLLNRTGLAPVFHGLPAYAWSPNPTQAHMEACSTHRTIHSWPSFFT